MEKQNRLEGKVAVVTGGGRGIGRAIALGLVHAGVCVTITAARVSEEIEAVAGEAGKDYILPLKANVTSEKDCIRVVAETEAHFGKVDILVNNAGRGMRFISDRFMTEPTRFWEADSNTWCMVIETNVNGPFFMAKAVLPGMIRRHWGRIINISMNHETMRRKGFSPYGPSKAVLESETIIWAQDLAGTGVTVNSLLPGGATRTGMIPYDVPEEIYHHLLSPEIIVPPLLWLVSDAADGVTGRRFNASRWDPRLPPSAGAICSVEHAGWVMPT